MEFIKDLVVQDSSLTKINDAYRTFKQIQVGENLYLSIQASYAHHCKPNITMNDLEQYSHWEFALLLEDEFAKVSDVCPKFSSLGEIEMYENQVYSYVPSDLVEELYIALKQK